MLVKKLRVDRGFLGVMLSLSVPIMIQNLVTSLLNMMDTVMVGKLGEVEIAAVGIANQYFFIFNMVLIGICGGCSVFIAQYWGKKDFLNIKRVLGLGLVSVAAASIFFMVVGFISPGKIISIFNKDTAVIELGGKYLNIVLYSYIFTGITFMYSFSLRAIGNTVIPLFVNIAALLTNVFFNYVLIFGRLGAPALGVEGAAIATLIARVVETIVIVFLVYRSRGVLAAGVSDLLNLSVGFFIRSYKIIMPVLMNDVLWGAASLIYSVVYGRMGTGAVAAVQICNTVSQMFMVAIFGMASAASIMIGNSIGEGNEEQAVDYSNMFMRVSTVVSVVLGFLMALSAPLVVRLFNVSEDVGHSTLLMLYTVAVIFIVRFLGLVIIVGILRGAGDAKSALAIEGATMWLIGVPLTIIGAFLFKFPVHIVYALAALEEATKFGFAFKRLRSRKWINNVT